MLGAGKLGQLVAQVFSWIDDSFPADPVVGNGRSLTYAYDVTGRVETITEKIGATVVGVTEYDYTFYAGSGLLKTEVETRCLNVGCTSSLVTTTTYIDEAAGRISRIDYPDGRVDQYGYDERR